MKNLEQLVENAKENIDGKEVLSCLKAHELSEKHDYSLKEIGKFCNDNKIKIISCQLGCFN